MHNEIQKTTKIIDEFASMMIRKGSNEIDIKIKREDNCTLLFFTEYNTKLTEEARQKLSDFLNIQRQSEIEEYYWGLMGETSTEDELFLVGSMVDSAELEIKDNNLYIKLVR